MNNLPKGNRTTKGNPCKLLIYSRLSASNLRERECRLAL